MNLGFGAKIKARRSSHSDWEDCVYLRPSTICMTHKVLFSDHEVYDVGAMNIMLIDGIEGRIEALGSDEKEILLLLLGRLEDGRREYGEWRVDDGRDLHKEIMEEIVDSMHYCAALLIRRKRNADEES